MMLLGIENFTIWDGFRAMVSIQITFVDEVMKQVKSKKTQVALRAYRKALVKVRRDIKKVDDSNA